ncbi:MAG: hypothetical protein EOO02_17895, partial [Chitinophagaceae bacterium]
MLRCDLVLPLTSMKMSILPVVAPRITASYFRSVHVVAFCFVLFIPCARLNAQVSVNDQTEADGWARKYKDDDVLCKSSYHYYTFDKGVNALNDKVVVVQEDAEMEFISLKKYSGLSYAEFYNKFVKLKTFRKESKVGNKFVTSAKSGIDRSLTDENIFFDDGRMQYYPIRFADKGSIARIVVKKEFGDAKYLTRVFFHESYPVAEQVYEFRVPEWMQIEFRYFNFEGYKIEKKETKKGGYINYAFIMRDVPATKSEFKQIGRAFTHPHIVIQVKSFKNKGETLQGFDNVNDIYNWNNRLYKMANNDPSKLKSQLSKIVADKKTDIEKIRAIYYWVQDKIRYIAYEDGYSGYIPSSAQDVLNNKYGDCKGMANLLSEFLKLAGYDARFTWIGTRQIPYQQSLPALCVNNHAITTLYFGGKEYFLDATEKYIPFGENAYRIQGKEALITNNDKFDIKTVPLTTGEQHKT